jgi:serine/threonine-protein kinase RsbW
MQGNEILRLRIPGAAEHIAIARSAVDAVGEGLHLSDEARMAVRLAVGEACANAVRHAKGSGPSGGPVVVVCRAGADTLEIDVRNRGNGFHPGSRATMPPPEALAEQGRGRALMELLMDSVEYLSVQGDTVVRMRKRRSPVH